MFIVELGGDARCLDQLIEVCVITDCDRYLDVLVGLVYRDDSTEL